MAQYDDRNPFSAPSGRPETNSPWGESVPDPGGGRGGLHLPGEADSAWGSDRLQRPNPEARRRNQWRQHQQLTPDFGGASIEPEPVPVPVPRPSARNASLPTFNRGPVSPPQPPTRPEGFGRQRPPAPPRSPQPGAAPLQMHPHSIHPSTLNSGGIAVPPGQAILPPGVLPSKVTPLRPQSRRWSKTGPLGPATAAAQAARTLVPDPSLAPESGAPPEGAAPSRRSRAATARRRLANPPLPLLYLIRLIILGVGVAAIAGTLLSVLSPSNVASPGSATPAPREATRPAGSLVQGGAATTVADLRLTSEIAHLKGELEKLATLTPGLTPVAFAVDLDSGQYVDLGGAEPVAAASTIKVPILVAFLQQVDAGTMALNQSLMLQEEYMAGGSGTLRGEAVGNEYTALDVATRMIVASDNTATNMMIAALGGIEALNQTFAGWGLEHTVLRNPLPDLDGTNTTSAKDMALIMALIDQGGLLTPRSRDRLLSIMQRTENISLIPSGIGDKSLTAHKTGDIGGLLGDVALVDVPNGKRYTLALLVQRPTNDGRASELIRRMTETVHAEMAQPVAPVGSPSVTPVGTPGAAPMGSPDATENPYTIENPEAVEPVDMNLPERAPARDEIPPG
ncbi:serine hydrolase [Nodosilinea sp. LEGE 06152]|uniref:serine hydrolase n=1 Tax=Nodosilinea sp. LEGE 06152 TaxID=2777966 RepID=UPI001881F958|nr:serine hydrolase [Nodosilinea sp. LEGE 06152]MBE9159516.1 serine hydrolase [Nodosilinea sp. LEGE 06152]